MALWPVKLGPSADIVCRSSNFQQKICQNRLCRRFLLAPLVERLVRVDVDAASNEKVQVGNVLHLDREEHSLVHFFNHCLLFLWVDVAEELIVEQVG